MTKMDIFMLTLFSTGILVLGFFLGFGFGFESGKASATPVKIQTPTGQDVLNELQEYRKSIGLSEFELSPMLCDSIAERWQNYKDTNSHAGFDEFAIKQYPPNFTVSEILVAGDSAEDMVEKWSKSPSHNQSIKIFSKICVYSAENKAVALLSN